MREIVLSLVPRHELGKSVEPENFARCVPDKLIVGGRYGFLCEGNLKNFEIPFTYLSSFVERVEGPNKFERVAKVDIIKIKKADRFLGEWVEGIYEVLEVIER